MTAPKACGICRAPFFQADPRWKYDFQGRQWRHNCVLSAPLVGGPDQPRPEFVPDIEIQLGSRQNSVLIMVSTMVSQIALDPQAALEIARGLIMHAARAGNWQDCRSDLPNLVRQMRRLQMDFQMDQTKRGAKAKRPPAMNVVQAAVDQWLERFDVSDRPALKTLEETANQPPPGPPS